MIRIFAAALPELRAAEQLAAIEAASVPYMDRAGHRETVDRHLRLIEGDAQPVRASDAELAAIGIQVEYVPKEVS